MEQTARPAAAAAITYQRPGEDAAEPLVAPVVPYGAPAPDNQSVGRSGSSSSFRLPPFWTAEPSLWFRQAESSFRRLNITASFAKYDLVLEALPQDVIISIRDLVTTITESTHMPYQQLKYRLLSSYSPSRWSLINRLLDTPPLGDRRPSVLMDSMLSLLPQDEPAGSLFLGLFLRRLPQDMRDHLSTRQFDTPHQMAETADLLWDARGHPQVTASGTAPALLMSTSLVAAAPAAPARRPSSPYPRRGRSPSPRSRARSPSSLCYYHRRFGPAARNCQPPCSWENE